MLPIEIIFEIVGFADWRTVIRMAGTCRKLRERMLECHWNVPFVPTNKKTAIHVLEMFKFNNIDLLQLADSRYFYNLGARIAEIFSETLDYVSLSTNSMFLMTGIQNADRRRRFDRLLFDIKYSAMLQADEYPATKFVVGRSNLHSPSMLHGFRWVTLTGDRKCEISSYAVYSARDCDVFEIVKMLPYESRTRELRLRDCNEDHELYVSCEKLYLTRSKIMIGSNCSYPEVKYIELDQDSMMIISASFDMVFPNAKTNAPSRIHILTIDMYLEMRRDYYCSAFDYVLRSDIVRSTVYKIVNEYSFPPEIDERDYRRFDGYINMGSEDEGDDRYLSDSDSD